MPVEAPLSPVEGRQARLVRFDSLVDEIVANATESHEARLSGVPRVPVTGWNKLDERIGGSLPPQGTTVVLGNTGAGKTAFCLQMAAQCAFPALYVTTEMTPAELFRRQMARVCGQFLGRIKSGELHPREIEAMARKTASALPNLCFVDATRGPATLSFLHDCSHIVRGDAAKLLLVVDSLHTWIRGAGSGAPEYEALNSGLVGLQTLSHQIASPIVVICEQSRASMDSGGVNSGAGTRFIEYGAEIVFDLQAAKEVDALGETPVTLRLAKTRHGAAGSTVKFAFNGALQRFKEV